MWSAKRVLMSGLSLGRLQRWCCQFKLQYNKNNNRNNQRRQQNLTFLLKESINSYLGDCFNYLWLINVLSLKFFKVGNWSLSRKSGFASINFFSTASTIALADLVSPYLDSCSFSLKKTNVCMKLHISELSYKSHFLWIQHIQKKLENIYAETNKALF